MEWTPEALKAEIDYRQTALRLDASQYRVSRRSLPTRPSWWRRLGHRAGPELPQDGNARRDAA